MEDNFYDIIKKEVSELDKLRKTDMYTKMKKNNPGMYRIKLGDQYKNLSSHFPIIFSTILDGDMNYDYLDTILDILKKKNNKEITEEDAKEEIAQYLIPKHIKPNENNKDKKNNKKNKSKNKKNKLNNNEIKQEITGKIDESGTFRTDDELAKMEEEKKNKKIFELYKKNDIKYTDYIFENKSKKNDEEFQLFKTL